MGGYSVHVHCRESTLHRQVSTKFLKKTQTADLKQGLNNVKYACELTFGLDLMVLTIRPSLYQEFINKESIAVVHK